MTVYFSGSASGFVAMISSPRAFKHLWPAPAGNARSAASPETQFKGTEND